MNTEPEQNEAEWTESQVEQIAYRGKLSHPAYWKRNIANAHNAEVAKQRARIAELEKECNAWDEKTRQVDLNYFTQSDVIQKARAALKTCDAEWEGGYYERSFDEDLVADALEAICRLTSEQPQPEKAKPL
jgi:hypothetical protein